MEEDKITTLDLHHTEDTWVVSTHELKKAIGLPENVDIIDIQLGNDMQMGHRQPIFTKITVIRK